MTDIFQQRYYKINRFFLGITGQWPYYSLGRRLASFVLYVFFMASVVVPQIIAVTKNWNDPNAALDSMPSLLVDIAYAIKFLNLVMNSNKMLKIFKRIDIDWTSVTQKPEVLPLLRETAEMGRKYTIVYAGGIYIAMILFMMLPIIPIILDHIHPTNVTEPREYPVPIDYYIIDNQAYYSYLLPHCYFATVTILTVIVAADTTFIVQVQHACGMFKVVGYQLQRMAEKIDDEQAIYSQPTEDPVFRHVAVCIKSHDEIIQYAELLRASYTWSFFCTVVVSSVFMSITGFLTVMKMNISPQEALRFGAVTVAQMMHLFFQNLISQGLIDQSDRVAECLYQAEWYRTSSHTQKLLNHISVRSRIYCRLTAGKFVVMSLESFGSLFKASLSYFTLFRSMQ